MNRSAPELLFDRQVALANLPTPELEHRFHPTRKWRIDSAWPQAKVGAEIEGGAWIAGRHTRGSGFVKDCEKYNAAALMGWRIFRFTPSMVRDGTALKTMQEVLT